MNKTIYKLLIVYWDALLASSIAFAFILLFTNHSGIGISPDSVKYLSAANNIATRFSFTDYTDTPFVLFPLGYPIFLAIIQLLFSASLIHIIPIINGFIFAGIVFKTAHILNLISPEKKTIKCLVLLLIATSPALLEIYTMSWSETLFIFFTLLFFISINKYAAQNNFKYLLLSATVASFAFLTRYAGITCLITGFVFILTKRRLLLSKKTIHFVCFGIVVVLLPLINLVRNILVTQTYAGVREKSLTSFYINLKNAAEVINQWIISPSYQFKIGLLLLLFLVILETALLQ